MALDLIVVLTSISGVKSLGSIISFKREDVFNRHEITIFYQNKRSSVLIKRLCKYRCIFSFLKNLYIS